MFSGLAAILASIIVCQVQAQDQVSREAEKRVSNSLHALYLADAVEYKIYRDVHKEEMLELRRQPIYAWTNPVRDGGQMGDVFVWTYRGRPEVVGSIFSHPWVGQRRVLHEFHSLSPVIIYPEGNPRARWQPRSAAVLKAVRASAKNMQMRKP